MLQRKSFVKKTRKGQVLKVVREHYLRDDIASGSPLDPDCDAAAAKLSATARHYLVVDTNIVLQQVWLSFAIYGRTLDPDPPTSRAQRLARSVLSDSVSIFRKGDSHMSPCRWICWSIPPSRTLSSCQ